MFYALGIINPQNKLRKIRTMTKFSTKNLFYITASLSLIAAASIFGFLEIQKERKKEAIKKELDQFYLNELRLSYSSILRDKKEETGKSKDWYITWNYERIDNTKEHMSKDGYNWQHIKTIDKEAENIAGYQIWNEELGYEDGLSGQEMNPERKSLLNDINGQNLHYHIGYDKGKKARLNK